MNVEGARLIRLWARPYKVLCEKQRLDLVAGSSYLSHALLPTSWILIYRNYG